MKAATMFNLRRKHRRHPDAVRRPRPRRLAVESMESRLLLTGNQLTGVNLDESIYNLDTVGPNPYVVISQGDVAAPSIADSNSTPAVDVPTTNIVPPAIVFTDYFGGGILNAGVSYGSTYDFLVSGTSSGPGKISSIAGNQGTFQRFDSDSDGSVGLGNLVAWTNSNSLDGTGVFFRLADDTVSVRYPIDAKWMSGLLSNPRILDAGPSAEFPRVTISVVIAPTVDVPLATPVLESKPIDAPLSTPIVEQLVQNDLTPVTTTAKPSADNANVAASKIDAVLDSIAGKEITVTIPAAIADAIPPIRQPMREERLADAIDELLSEDTILVAPSGKNGTDYVADGSSNGLATASDFNAGGQSESELFGSPVQIADGGMIPIDALIAAADSDAGANVADASTELAATDVPTGALGELSRVAVMELIEGETEPGAGETSDHVMVVADHDAEPLDAFRVVAHQAGVAIALASPAGPTYLASIATAAVEAANRAMATLVGNHIATEAASELTSEESVRQAAFSELGGAENEVETTAALDGPHWSRWLAAAPLAVAIACERALAARKSRREQRDPARPRTAT